MFLALLSCVALVATCSDIGWTWDEVYYFLSSELQIEWSRTLLSALRAGNLSQVLSRETLDAYWLWDITHNPHPPLYKILSSVSLVLFKNILDDFTAYRLSTMLLAGLLTVFLFCTVEKRYGLVPALYGALSLLGMPLFFGHAHFAATEIPLATFWFCSYWAFWRGLDKISGSVLLGIFLGCALATKFTAVLIPCAFILWSILYREKRALRNLLAMALSPCIAVALNPGWWYQPVHKIWDFILMSTSRQDTIPISTFFLGKTYVFSPPWYYAPVMTGVTIPLTILLTILLGTMLLAKQKFRNSYDNLFLLNIPLIYAVVMLPNAPVHDGIRQFFSLLPFLAYLAGMGFFYLGELIKNLQVKAYLKNSFIALCFLSFIMPAGYQIKQYHPYELSYYNELIGGLRGAYEKGMEVTYWFDVINTRFLDEFARQVPDGARVSVWPPNIDYFIFLQSRGKIKKEVTFFMPAKEDMPQEGQPEKPEYCILMSRLGAFNSFYWRIFKGCKPVFSSELDGVPLVSLYRW